MTAGGVTSTFLGLRKPTIAATLPPIVLFPASTSDRICVRPPAFAVLMPMLLSICVAG